MASSCRKLGWIRDREEHVALQPRFELSRAKHFGAVVTTLPEKFSGLRSLAWTRDQEGTSACVGFAFTGAVYARLCAIGFRPELLSPLATYGITRQLDGGRDLRRSGGRGMLDGGSIPYLAIRSGSEFGFVPESVYPFVDDGEKVLEEVDFETIMRQAQFRVSSFSRFEGSREAYREFVMRAAVALHPTMIGMDVGKAFMNHRKGDPPVDVESKDSIEGGHMVWISGYEDNGNVLLVQNSWGKEYGDNGIARITLDKAYEQGSDQSELALEKMAA